MESIVIEGIGFNVEEVKKMSEKEFLNFFCSIEFINEDSTEHEKKERFSRYYKMITGKQEKEKANERPEL